LDNSFQGISRLPQMPKSVTHVLGKSVTYVPGRTSKSQFSCATIFGTRVIDLRDRVSQT
jgi:hypothetical protein